MAKIRTLSRYFMSNHPRSTSSKIINGKIETIKLPEATFFVEKFLNSQKIDYKNDSYLQMLLGLNTKNIANGKLSFEDIESFWLSLQPIEWEKVHTVRGGKHFKAGDNLSLRCWFGKPYKSPQIIIAPDVLVRKTYDIEIYPTNEIMLNDKFFCSFGSEKFYELAKNDGLDVEDFKNWFGELPFSGQIISWSDKIQY